MSLRIGILGATGFGGGELLRLLSMHPAAEVVSVTSRSAAGQPVGSVHPHLEKVWDVKFEETISKEVDLVFSSLPHGESGAAIESVLTATPGVSVIDLSGDLRLKDLDSHRKHYSHSPDLATLRSSAVYGLSELNGEAIKDASLVANPGCLATAMILSLLPFAGLPLRSVHIHGATGSSGSGKEPKASTHHPVRHANFLAYKVLEHQHVPEVLECLQAASVKVDDLPFVAHSLPVSRGILNTAFVELERPMVQSEVEALFAGVYQDKPFVRLKGSKPAEIENVVGSNFCDISVVAKGTQVVVHSAIDNLVKGMAGQAIQNMNLMFGLPETAGLWTGGWRPV